MTDIEYGKTYWQHKCTNGVSYLPFSSACPHCGDKLVSEEMTLPLGPPSEQATYVYFSEKPEFITDQV